jgi:hypothetical protein
LPPEKRGQRDEHQGEESGADHGWETKGWAVWEKGPRTEDWGLSKKGEDRDGEAVQF